MPFDQYAAWCGHSTIDDISSVLHSPALSGTHTAGNPTYYTFPLLTRTNARCYVGFYLSLIWILLWTVCLNYMTVLIVYWSNLRYQLVENLVQGMRQEGKHPKTINVTTSSVASLDGIRKSSSEGGAERIKFWITYTVLLLMMVTTPKAVGK